MSNIQWNAPNLPFFLVWLQWNASAHFNDRLHKRNMQVIFTLWPQICAEDVFQVLHTTRVSQVDPIQIVDFHFDGVECIAGLMNNVQRQNGMSDLVTSFVYCNHIQLNLKLEKIHKLERFSFKK